MAEPILAARPEGLHLRAFRADDAEALHAIVSDWEVVRMTASWPFPPDRAFTAERCKAAEGKPDAYRAVLRDGCLVGMVGLRGGVLGYMLDRAHWRQGIMSSVLSTVLSDHFRAGGDPITAKVWHDNRPSAALLQRLGFRWAGTDAGYCRARDAEVWGDIFRCDRWAGT